MEVAQPQSPAASSDDRAPAMTPELERPEQRKFNKDETKFLKTHLPAYEALCHQLATNATEKGTGSVKGHKKDWVLSKVFPEFVKQFSSDQNGGPQLQSLRTKILRWFTNHSPHRKVGSGSQPFTTATSIATPKHQRATNGPSVFAEEHKKMITELMAAQQQQEGGVPKHVNLTRYRTVKQELYSQLTSEEQHAYEARAAKQNNARKALPEKSENFKNQENMMTGVVKALSSLIGWDWGQYGEAAFFVQAAFRNADDDLKMFNVSVTPNAKITGFSSMLPDYKDVLRGPFREWAKNALPVHSPHVEGSPDITNQKYVIELHEDGLPHLPIFDLDQVAPNDARLMLKTYIELTWKFAIQQSIVRDEVTVPWDSLNTAVLRRKLLVDPDSFSHVKTLDPMRMTLRDVYDVLDLLLKGQIAGVRLLQFSIRENFNSEANLQDDDIQVSLPDPLTPPPKPHTASPGESGIDNAIAELDSDIGDLHDPSSQSLAKRTSNTPTGLNPASPRDVGISCTITELDNNGIVTSWAKRTAEGKSHTASLRNKGIDGTTETHNGAILGGSLIRSPLKGTASTEPHTTSPRESDIEIVHLQDYPLSAPAASPAVDLPFTKVAIQNVALAGYLSIVPGANTTKDPSQQVNSKRTQKEIISEEDHSGKQTRKRVKIAVPAREQSLRLKDSNYKNKHVTVRMR